MEKGFLFLRIEDRLLLVPILLLHCKTRPSRSQNTTRNKTYARLNLKFTQRRTCNCYHYKGKDDLLDVYIAGVFVFYALLRYAAVFIRYFIDMLLQLKVEFRRM